MVRIALLKLRVFVSAESFDFCCIGRAEISQEPSCWHRTLIVRLTREGSDVVMHVS